MLIISDEIHADIIYKSLHHSIGSFANIQEHCVIFNAPSKTFNIAGLNTSYAIIPQSKLRKRYKLEQDKSGITNGNPFGIEALITAYTKGGSWVDALKEHLEQNCFYVRDFLEQNKIPIKVVPNEATFLLWLDCSRLKLTHEELTQFFYFFVKLGLNDGESFGKAGEGFMRLNIGTSHEILEEAMKRLLLAYKGLKI